MISACICILTIKQIGISLVIAGIFFMAGAFGLLAINEDDETEVNKAEERLRANKLKAEQAEKQLEDYK